MSEWNGFDILLVAWVGSCLGVLTVLLTKLVDNLLDESTPKPMTLIVLWPIALPLTLVVLVLAVVAVIVEAAQRKGDK